MPKKKQKKPKKQRERVFGVAGPLQLRSGVGSLSSVSVWQLLWEASSDKAFYMAVAAAV